MIIYIMVGLLKLTCNCKAVQKHLPFLRIAILRYCSFTYGKSSDRVQAGTQDLVGQIGQLPAQVFVRLVYPILRKGLDTVESLSVEVKGSKVANFTVLVTLLPTLVTYFCHFQFCRRDQKQGFCSKILSKYLKFCRREQKQGFFPQILSKYLQFCRIDQK